MAIWNQRAPRRPSTRWRVLPTSHGATRPRAERVSPRSSTLFCREIIYDGKLADMLTDMYDFGYNRLFRSTIHPHQRVDIGERRRVIHQWIPHSGLENITDLLLFSLSTLGHIMLCQIWRDQWEPALNKLWLSAKTLNCIKSWGCVNWHTLLHIISLIRCN